MSSEALSQDPPLIEKPKASRIRRWMRILLWLVVSLPFLLVVLPLLVWEIDPAALNTAAEAQMNTLRTALIQYKKDHGRLPTTEEGLQALVIHPSKASFQQRPIAPSHILDPWESPYQYRMPSQDPWRKFDLWSLGPDKKNKTEDDIPGFNDR